MDDYRESEWQDLFDQNGHYAGRHFRGDPIPEGTYHHLVTVFTLNSRHEILLTQRAMNKSYPGMWETTAGAVLEGEKPLHAAMRELFEETGLSAKEEELIYLGAMQTTKKTAWMHGYFLHSEASMDQIRLQEGETMDAKWVPLDWALCFDQTLAVPVHYRLLYFWQSLESFLDPRRTEDPYLHFEDRWHPWLSWAKEIQFLAQQGQAYTKDPFDRERFDRLSELACEMISYKTGVAPEKVMGLFAYVQDAYRTPNVEVRAAVFRENRILLVKEKMPQAWSMPGGWCDPGLTVGENAVKECREEAGISVRPVRLIAVENRKSHDYKYVMPFDIYKIYILCEETEKSQTLKLPDNPETTDVGFFDVDHLPEISEARISERAVRMCLEAKKNPQWIAKFD